MRAKLLAVKIELRRKMHDPIAKTGAWVKQMLKGHLNYFAVSGNHPSLVLQQTEAALLGSGTIAEFPCEAGPQIADRYLFLASAAFVAAPAKPEVPRLVWVVFDTREDAIRYGIFEAAARGPTIKSRRRCQ
jgi:hypothetical protein